ncbi:MAG: ABC transporter ATP-binding protein [Opitutales bacterium]|nr:ABC transporter ATP-binding protein [Opitutales bacterium]MCH8540195.1 ABC transporter ATP-binding protein [Opitutales bacterium]
MPNSVVAPTPTENFVGPVLTVQGLSKTYGKLQALHNVNLEIEPGEIFALLGVNGAGKTTMIECICGLQAHFEGQISVAGFDVRKEYARARQITGLVPQELNFDGFFRSLETVSSQGGYFGLRQPDQKARALMKRLSLEGKEKDNTRNLSGGMKRRLMIAKALMHDPALLFLDEPTAGVDVELRDDLWEYVRELRGNGTTIVLTTHYLEEAEKLADRIGIINRGRLLLVERRDHLMDKFGRKRVTLRTAQPLPKHLSRELRIYQWEEGQENEYHFHFRRDETEPTLPRLFELLGQYGVSITDVETRQSRLEDIFRELLQSDDETTS